MFQKLENCSIRCTKPYGDSANYIEISIGDEESRLVIAEIQIPYLEWIKATFSSQGSCTVQLNSSSNFGKAMQVQTINIPYPPGVNRKPHTEAEKNTTEELLRGTAIGQLAESEGWMGDYQAAFRTQQPWDSFNVIFRKWG